MTIAERNKNLDKNPNLKPVKKVWLDPIAFSGYNGIENKPETLCADDLLVWKGQELSQNFLRTISEDRRDEIAKSVYNYLYAYDWNEFHYNKVDVQRSFESLKKYKGSVEKKDGVLYLPNGGAGGYQIYRNFFPNIMKINDGKRPSVYDVVNNKEKLWATIRNRIGNHQGH